MTTTSTHPHAAVTPTAEVQSPRLFIVLPAFNEGAALSQLTASFGPALPHCSFQILVVDDGSTDDSMSILEAARVPRVDIIRHPQNRGLGEAVKTGFLVALERANPNDIIAVMDSDGTHSPYLIDRMIQLIKEGNDVVVASRYRYGSQVVGLDWFRTLLSHGSSWVFRITNPIFNIKDYTCGFRLYRASILQKAFQTYGDRFITEAGFACMAEIIMKLNRVGALFCEVPMILRYDQKVSTSKIKIARTILRSLNLVRRGTTGAYRQQS
ncbi:glycosyltransferase family 2 protein [Vampirovibrio chlorellavorus]|uniref:glycosyltransferase family 2 protein n=1 Tax=Vampirovibrio chlorellavorus TaxID=758823 RepID=UPI0026EDE1EB|nr:glycosyltransferase family 2 protein [Vampirovibrio chlorellavorus]